MRVGDVILTNNVREYFVSDVAKGYANFSSGKNEFFVLVWLGNEPRDGSAPLNLEERMRLIGWERIPKARHSKIVEEYKKAQKS